MNQITVTTLAADWNRLGDTFGKAILDTLIMVAVTMVVAGLLGLVVGMLLYTTREGGILRNNFVYTTLNLLVNFVRPIPFIILIAAIKPLTVAAIGTSIGRNAGIFVMIIAATFTVARIVEQNLVAIDPGVIEAARSMGASPWKIITSVIIPEALGPWCWATPSSLLPLWICLRWSATSAAAAWVTLPSSTVTEPLTMRPCMLPSLPLSFWSRPPNSWATGCPRRSCAASTTAGSPPVLLIDAPSPTERYPPVPLGGG